MIRVINTGNTCSKSLSRMDVCPVKIQMIASMAKMNIKCISK